MHQGSGQHPNHQYHHQQHQRQHGAQGSTANHGFAPNAPPLLPKTSASLIDNRTPELSPVPTPPLMEGDGAVAAAAAAAAAAAVAAAGGKEGVPAPAPGPVRGPVGGTVVPPGLNPAGFPSLGASLSPANGLAVGGKDVGASTSKGDVEVPLASIADSLAEMRIGAEEVPAQP